MKDIEKFSLARKKVYSAVTLFEAQGKSAFPLLKDLQGKFGPTQEVGCIGIHSLSGPMVLHPTNPSMEGKNLLYIQDSTGFFYVQAMNWVVEKHGEGWVFYVWINPNHQKEEMKASFIKGTRMEGEKYFIGCSLFGLTKEQVLSFFPDDFACDCRDFPNGQPSLLSGK
jgi:signal transduction histidine kinase